MHVNPEYDPAAAVELTVDAICHGALYIVEYLLQQASKSKGHKAVFTMTLTYIAASADEPLCGPKQQLSSDTHHLASCYTASLLFNTTGPAGAGSGLPDRGTKTSRSLLACREARDTASAC
jgi:hypothetical protein